MTKSFSGQFSEAWSRPDPDHFVSLLHDEVVLYQPHRRTIIGKRDVHREFTSLINAFPTIYGVVDRYLEADDVAFIEWRVMLPCGATPVAIPMVDRFFIRDGLGIERKVYFDQWYLARQVLLNPGLLPPVLKYYFF